MKFLGVIAFLLLMNWSWSLIHTEVTTSEAVHIGIQNDMKQIISDYIKENLPGSQNLKFSRFWTEKLSEKKIKASFIYSFEDSNAEIGTAKVEVEGTAILSRAPDEDDAMETWSFDELMIEDNKIEFKDGIQISGSLDEL
ncbi:MAG: hypothetical protein AAF202_13410 [Pseudomonadota bacterium]